MPSFFYTRNREYIQKNPPVPHLDDGWTRRKQVGAASRRLELSVKQTLSIASNDRSRKYNVDSANTSNSEHRRSPSIIFFQNSFVNEMKGGYFIEFNFSKKGKISISKLSPNRLSDTSFAERRMAAAVKSAAKKMLSATCKPRAKQPTKAAANASPEPQKKPSTFSWEKE